MRKRQNSIKQTLIFKISLLIVLINAVVGIAFYLFSQRSSEIEFEQQVQLHVKHLSDTFAQQLWLFDLTTTDRLAELALETSDIQGLRLRDHGNAIIVEKGTLEKDADRYISKTLYYGEKHAFVGTLDVALLNNFWLSRRWYVLLVGLSSVALTLITTVAAVSYLLTKHLSLPLDELQQDMEQLAEGEFIQSELAGSKTEVQRIVFKFNEMVEALKQREQERFDAEKQMLAMQERFLSLFRESRDSIFTATHDGKIVDINPAMLALLDYLEEDITDISIGDIFINEENEMPVMEYLNKKGTIADYPINVVTKGGNICNCLLSGSQWKNSSGKTLGYQGIIRDITEQKMLETQLSQARKMESIGTLAGGIAHDFNNILSILYGYSEIIQLELETRGTENKEEITQIFLALDRARDLVKQILAFSRQAEAETIPLQMVSLVKEIVKMLRSSIPTTIDIKEHYDSNCGMVLADPVQVQQIVMNLCTNAHHSMETEGGILAISLDRCVLTKPQQLPAPELQYGNYTRLTISDTGHGIKPSLLDRIFDPYFTTKEQGKGTGMGLAITHGIIAKYRGAITVKSQIGEGTTFTAYLPQAEHEINVVENESQTVPHGNERILLVDDEVMLAQMAEQILDSLGYEVTVSTSSVEALSIFMEKPHHFDLVITDQTMPEMTGLDIARRMLKERADLSIILCTGYSTLVDEETVLAEGIKGFALKPLSRSELARIIRKVIDS